MSTFTYPIFYLLAVYLKFLSYTGTWICFLDGNNIRK